MMLPENEEIENKSNNNHSKSNHTIKTDEKLKSKINRNQIAYLIISFNQGLSTISELAISYFFKDELKLEPATLSQTMSFVTIPWMLKPIFGLITDLVPIFGYRRKFYIIFCGVFTIISWLLLALWATTLFEATSLLFMINVGLSFSTVVGEAIVVELSQLKSEGGKDKNTAKDYVSLFFFFKYVGALISAYMKGLLVELVHVRTVFLIASFIPWLLILSGFILIEETEQEKIINNTSNNNSFRLQPEQNLLKEFFDFLCQKFVIIPTVFLIIFTSTPSYSDPFFYFLTNELKFSPTDLGKIAFFSTLATLIAILMYKWHFKNCNFKLIITIGTVISFMFSFFGYLLVLRVNVQYGISDFVLVLFSSSFLSMLGEIIMMPMLSLACLLSPKNLEATVYSLFMSALNFGYILSNLDGSLLTTYFGITVKNIKNLDKLILVSNLLTLFPLPLLLCIPSSYFQPEENNQSSEGNGNRIGGEISQDEVEKLIIDKIDNENKIDVKDKETNDKNNILNNNILTNTNTNANSPDKEYI